MSIENFKGECSVYRLIEKKRFFGETASQTIERLLEKDPQSAATIAHQESEVVSYDLLKRVLKYCGEKQWIDLGIYENSNFPKSFMVKAIKAAVACTNGRPRMRVISSREGYRLES